MEEAKELARIFKYLSVEARVRIVQMLKDHVLCVNALSDRLNMTQGAVSQHLRILREAGLVLPEKRGNFVHYRLNPQKIAAWQGQIQPLLTVVQTGLPVVSPDKTGRKAKTGSAGQRKR